MAEQPQSTGTKPPRDVLRPLRRRAAIAWASWLLSIGLLYWQHRQQVLHPRALLFIALVAVTLFAGLVGLLHGLGRTILGPRRRPALALALLAIAPMLIWAAIGAEAYQLSKRKNHPDSLRFTIMQRVGHNLMEAQARYLYPHRRESQRLVMIFRDGLPDPDGDLRAMDEHVARM